MIGAGAYDFGRGAVWIRGRSPSFRVADTQARDHLGRLRRGFVRAPEATGLSRNSSRRQMTSSQRSGVELKGMKRAPRLDRKAVITQRRIDLLHYRRLTLPKTSCASRNRCALPLEPRSHTSQCFEGSFAVSRVESALLFNVSAPAMTRGGWAAMGARHYFTAWALTQIVLTS